MQSEIEKAWNSSEYDANSFVKNFDDTSSFTVTGVEETEENSYTVKLNVTSANILESFKQYQSSVEKMPSDEEINEKIKELISTSQKKTTEQTVTVFKTDDGFSVLFSEGFIDAMFGYSYIYCMDEMHNILEGNE